MARRSGGGYESADGKGPARRGGRGSRDCRCRHARPWAPRIGRRARRRTAPRPDRRVRRHDRRDGARRVGRGERSARSCRRPKAPTSRGVEPDGAAAKAGIASGDIIVEFDGERVRSARQLSRLVRESPDGRPVRSVLRARRQPADRGADAPDPISAWVYAARLQPARTADARPVAALRVRLQRSGRTRLGRLGRRHARTVRRVAGAGERSARGLLRRRARSAGVVGGRRTRRPPAQD